MTAGRRADPFDLERFVAAQEGCYEQALAELRAGRKRSHWMWYVLPQLRGLGASTASTVYGISGLDEARAYLAHPVLGPRLLQCVGAINALPDVDAERVLGEVDAMKLRSCLTLFERAADDPAPFALTLERCFAGQRDPKTLQRLGARPA